MSDDDIRDDLTRAVWAERNRMREALTAIAVGGIQSDEKDDGDWCEYCGNGVFACELTCPRSIAAKALEVPTPAAASPAAECLGAIEPHGYCGLRSGHSGPCRLLAERGDHIGASAKKEG
jgi:hypothetical protein